MIKAIIFDKDGVLIDSEDLKAESWERTFLEIGLMRGGGEWYRKRIGNPRVDLIKTLKKQFGEISSYSVEKITSINQKFYDELRKEEIPPVHSSIKFLKSLPQGKYKIALATSDHAHISLEQIDKLGLANIFEAITSGADEDIRDKPAPDVYLATAKKLEVNPSECLVIEDSLTGILSAKSAGMYCVGFSNPKSGNQDLSQADQITKDLTSIDITIL